MESYALRMISAVASKSDKELLSLMQDVSTDVARIFCGERSQLNGITAPLYIAMFEKYSKTMRDRRPDAGALADDLKKVGSIAVIAPDVK